MRTFGCIRLARLNLDSRPQYSNIPGEVSPMGQPADLGKILLEAVDEGLLVPGEIVTELPPEMGSD